MEVLILQVFVSLVLVLGSIILFLHSAKQKDHQHADRLALLPLESDPAVEQLRAVAKASPTSTSPESRP